MKRWNLKEFVSHFKIKAVVLNMGDNIDILYQENLYPVKIDGVFCPELKVVKGSYCNYGDDIENVKQDDIELLAIEEYSDALNSIYIDEDGTIDSPNYKVKNSIELGSQIKLIAKDNKVVGYVVNNIHQSNKPYKAVA